jgi:hypothetical protein
MQIAMDCIVLLAPHSLFSIKILIFGYCVYKLLPTSSHQSQLYIRCTIWSRASLIGEYILMWISFNV